MTRTYKTSASNCSSPTGTTNYLLGDLFETNGSGTLTTSYVDGPAGDLASFNGGPTTSSTVTYLYCQPRTCTRAMRIRERVPDHRRRRWQIAGTSTELEAHP